MEEMLNKFINEGKREQEEMDTFIREFRTTNELLLKEQNNLLSVPKIRVHELSKVISDVLVSRYKIKGVTMRGGNITKVIYNKEINETNINRNDPPRFQPNEQVRPEEGVVDKESPNILEWSTQPAIKPQQPPVPFPNRLIKEKEEAQQRKFLENLKQLHINIPFIEALVQMPKYAKYLKSLLTNKLRLEEACTVTMNERCPVLLLNKLQSKEKDPGSFTISCHVSNLHINNALADLGASISLMPYTMFEKLGLGELKPTRMILKLEDRSIQYQEE
ncbi:retrovirus-related pol polyprotein from transposon TNT 1-94 [Tanacetum coccineum]|uniref:Retrovirus-related pol polyprotein from transposon TNT 1-94 n=1 Tax=Tanacetum coccineum TaxID=301880 RepID=A0ABQ5EK15_9ASTR